MNENAFYKLVSDTADEYTRILAEVQASLKKAPEGNLHIIKKNGKPYYYLQKRIAKNKYALTYIPKKNRKLLSALAQKKYDKKILPMVKENLKAINELLDNYEFGLLEEERSMRNRRLSNSPWSDLTTAAVPSGEPSSMMRIWYPPSRPKTANGCGQNPR